jgi:hypothetical protein
MNIIGIELHFSDELVNSIKEYKEGTKERFFTEAGQNEYIIKTIIAGLTASDDVYNPIFLGSCRISRENVQISFKGEVIL